MAKLHLFCKKERKGSAGSGIGEPEKGIGVTGFGGWAEAGEVAPAEGEKIVLNGEAVRAGDGVPLDEVAEIPLEPGDGIRVVPDVGPALLVRGGASLRGLP